MSDTGADINTPPLRPAWKVAKDKSEKLAEKSAPDKPKYAKLDKSFDDKFGPQLDDWFKPWPNLTKVVENKEKLDKVIADYKKKIREANLTAPVAKPMVDALKDIETTLDERLAKASTAIQFNVSAGLKASKATPDIRPIRIFQGQDGAKTVNGKLKAAKGVLELDRFDLEIILDDPKILESVPSEGREYSSLTQEMYDAADYDKITSELASAMDALALTVHSEADRAKAEAKVLAQIDKILDDAADRASVPFTTLTKAKINHTKYKFKKGATIGIMVVGIAASISALATAPFSGGAHGVVAVAGLLKTARGLYVVIEGLARSVEAQADLVAHEVEKLSDKYKEASSGKVGASEMRTALVNAFWPEATKSISDCKGHCGDLKSRVAGLIVECNTGSTQLEEALKEQRKATAELATFEKSAKQTLDVKELKRVVKLIEKDEETGKEIVKLFERTASLLTRAKTQTVRFLELDKAVTALAAKEPTWAVIGEIFIKASVSAGFIAGGAVHAPEGFELVKEAHSVVEGISRAMDSSDAAKEAIADVAELVRSAKKAA